jgi:hypothetical protein
MLVADFWESFFLFLIFVPLAMIWAFALFDIFRRDDIGGVSKALWVATVIILPFFGTLIYLVVRPVGGTPEERAMLDDAGREFVKRYSGSAADELKTLADLHDRGKLTDDEFAAEKARITGVGGAAPS